MSVEVDEYPSTIKNRWHLRLAASLACVEAVKQFGVKPWQWLPGDGGLEFYVEGESVGPEGSLSPLHRGDRVRAGFRLQRRGEEDGEFIHVSASAPWEGQHFHSFSAILRERFELDLRDRLAAVGAEELLRPRSGEAAP